MSALSSSSPDVDVDVEGENENAGANAIDRKESLWLAKLCPLDLLFSLPSSAVLRRVDSHRRIVGFRFNPSPGSERVMCGVGIEAVPGLSGWWVDCEVGVVEADERDGEGVWAGVVGEGC